MGEFDKEKVHFEFIALCEKSSQLPDIEKPSNPEWIKKNRYSNIQPCTDSV